MGHWEPYRAGHSIVHRLDPTGKLVLTLGLILVSSLAGWGDWPVYILLAALVWAAAILAELDLRQVAELWQHGSVIRSWLMELAERALAKDPHLETIKGNVGGGATGSWAIEEGWKAGAPMIAIAVAYAMRLRSRQPDSFAGKVVAALRYEFGGHETVPAEAPEEPSCPR